MYYGYSFLKECLTATTEMDKAQIVNSAISHRGSKAEDFSEFTKAIEAIGVEKQADHAANLDLLKGGMS